MSLTLCQKCVPRSVEQLSIAILTGTCEGCGLRGSSPELVRVRVSDVLSQLRKFEAEKKVRAEAAEEGVRP